MGANQDKEQSKKELILQTTLQLLKEKGLEGVTIRNIARHADINPALINYYFGSKDKLVNIAIKNILTTALDTFATLENNNLPPKERLKQFLIQYVKIVKTYPSIFRRALHKKTFEFDSQKEYLEFFNVMGLNKILATVKEITGEEEHQKNVVVISHLIGAIVLPVLAEPLLKKSFPYELPSLEENINLLFSHYFSESSFKKETI